jgi:uncharacterized protein
MAGPPIKVLAIDGGGIRGIIPATVLAEVERRTGAAVSDAFDLIAGTSTGGILALALTKPGEAGAPAYAAEELVELYEEEGPRIFSRSLWQCIRSGKGLLDEKYSADGLEQAFDTYFGDARLSDALTDVIVTAYDIERRDTFFFKSGKARADAAHDFAMRDAAHATSAAPTYFEPVRIERGAGHLALVDGGVFAVNPAMSAYAEALGSEPSGAAGEGGSARDVLILSLGTGELTRPLPWSEAKDWGLVEWAKPILDVVFDGVADATDHHLERLLGPGRYYRFQTTLDRASDDLDDASDENLERLKREAAELIARDEERLDEVCRKL